MARTVRLPWMLVMLASLLTQVGRSHSAEQSQVDLKTIVVQVISEPNPYETPVGAVDARFAATNRERQLRLSHGEEAVVMDTLVQELSKLGEFRRVSPSGTNWSGSFKPVLGLKCYVALWGRDPKETKGDSKYGGGVKPNGQEFSDRKRQGSGLEIRFELEEVSSGQTLVKWYSFCNAMLGEKREIVSFSEALIEDKFVEKIRRTYARYSEVEGAKIEKR